MVGGRSFQIEDLIGSVARQQGRASDGAYTPSGGFDF